MSRDWQGNRLIPGYNADEVDIDAGIRQAAEFGYDSPSEKMTVQYALMRHARGEEDGAEATARNGGISLTSWYAIRAAALSSPALAEKRESVQSAVAAGRDPLGRHGTIWPVVVTELENRGWTYQRKE